MADLECGDASSHSQSANISRTPRFLNPNRAFAASYFQRIIMIMKTSFIACAFSLALAVSAFGQSPTGSPVLSPAPSAAASVSPSGDLADKIQQRIEQKFRKHHHGVTIGDHEAENLDSGDIPEQVFPIVGITMLTVFGMPVLIVGVIMLMNYLKARSLHRTVQTMVEKGQPVPAALLAPPAVPRVRSDLRRGIILVMVGLGIAVFFAATDWGDSSWSFGAIPFLIGVGYLIVWKLEKKKDNAEPVS
jgi:hypothetical protein